MLFFMPIIQTAKGIIQKMEPKPALKSGTAGYMDGANQMITDIMQYKL